jgi:hypothetical protein
VSQLREKFVGLKAKIDRRVKHIGTPRGDVSCDLIEYIGAAGCERRSKITDTSADLHTPTAQKSVSQWSSELLKSALDAFFAPRDMRSLSEPGARHLSPGSGEERTLSIAWSQEL